MVYCKLNKTNYDEHFTHSLEKIVNDAVALADDYLIQDDMAEAMGGMLDKLGIEYQWISIAVELAPHDWDETEIVEHLHKTFPNAKRILIHNASAQYVYIDVDGADYRLTADGDIENV